MSMENGFELDFPGDDDNAGYCDFGCMPMDHGIGEPDAASIDEFPKTESPWQPTHLEISQGRGETDRLSFITVNEHGGSFTETIRLTRPESVRAWMELGVYLGMTT